MRFICLDDAQSLYENIYSDDEVLKYFIAKRCTSIEEAKDVLNKTFNYYIDKKEYCFAVILKETQEIIGLMLECGLTENTDECTEVGYAIGRKFWNKGYTSEALNRFIQFLFDKGIQRVEASCILENISSKRVMEKCEMVSYQIKENDINYHDKWWNTEYFYKESK